MAHVVRMGAKRRVQGVAAAPPSATRQERVLAALTASGEVGLPLPTYELTQGSAARLRFTEEAFKAGFDEWSGASWPCDTTLEVGPAVLFTDGAGDVVYRLRDGTLVHASQGHGWLHLRVASGFRENVAAAIGAFQAQYPALYYTQAETNDVPITFWMNGNWGPESRLRKVESASWEQIEENYTAAVRAELAGLMTGFEPGKDGQLLLWQGPPGTGKTWALRALASEWAAWAEFHYITDPDAFFVERASYMIEVLLSDSYSSIEEETGSLVEQADPEGKWRVLILEDTGELLAANAKESYGQGLSRLLNVVDGLVGQGLRVLVLVTTNDELGALHPAVSRPGRCASQIEFAELTAEETSELLGRTVEEGMTIAEVYAAQEASEEPAEGDARAAVARAAEELQGEAEGYGETAWNPDTRTVLYVAGDWTEIENVEPVFLAIPGVDNFEHEAENLPEGWWDAEVVYPDDPPRWVTDPELQMHRILELASRPLTL